MTTVLILVVVAGLMVLAIRRAVRGYAAVLSDPEQMIGRTCPVDLLAFQNLTDPDDEEYLHKILPWHAFLRVRWLRYQAARDYVRLTAHNAAILVQLGQLAQTSSEVRLRQAGKELVTIALYSRMYAAVAYAQLRIAVLIPWWTPSLRSFAMTYTKLRDRVDQVVRLQRPELAGRIAGLT